MIGPDSSLAQEWLEKIAADYRARGYTVAIQPSGADLPSCLRDYEPDLIARGPTESLVIEMKVSASTADAERLQAIADRVAQQPGWRFVLVAPPPAEELLAGEPLSSLDEPGIQRRLQEAELLHESGHFEAALMLAWAAAEAALRLVAESERIPLRRPDTLTLLRELASEGVVDRAHFRQLNDLFRWRSALAHGFRTQETVRAEDVRAALKSLSDFTRELLAEQRKSA